MAYRLFIDLETTGDGSNKYHDIIDISATLTHHGNSLGVFNAQYSYDNKSSFQGGRNYNKAKHHKELGRVTSSEGIDKFIVWLDKHVGKYRCFLVSYNCDWDWKHLQNWFWRNKKGDISKYFYDTCICSMSLCSCRYDKWLKLETCADNLGIQIDESRLHTAAYDNYLNQEIYSKISAKIRA